MSTPKFTPLEFIRKLTAVGIALSSEKDNNRLMEHILGSAKELTNADGGTLYRRTDDDQLVFEIMLTDSLDIHKGGTSGEPMSLPPLPMFDADGRPNERMVAARAAVTGETVNVQDAYRSTEFDFSGTREFDERTGYRSTSFLTVPMRNHEDEVIGVLQLINATDTQSGEVVPFSREDQELVESLASQAAIAWTKKRLIDDQRRLFESFIELIAKAIDDKSPYTGGHCRRVPILTMMIADAAAATTEGPLADFHMSEDDRYELRVAAWLHDCGKITTPEYVVDKATKLQTIFDRVELIDTRFEVLRRDAEIEMLRRKLAARGGDGSGHGNEQTAEREYRERVEALDAEREFVRRCNEGGETLADGSKERVDRIAGVTWRDPDGRSVPFLSEEERRNLKIERGTLLPEEREIIKNHVAVTIEMLESLPYPTNLRRVPEFAGCHHERMDGQGYPRGLTGEEMSIQARCVAIADVFEALTAGDRPYKKAMPLSQALTIMGRMKLESHIDPDLFDVFVRGRLWLRYAREHLRPEQLDTVDVSQLPGFEAAREETH